MPSGGSRKSKSTGGSTAKSKQEDDSTWSKALVKNAGYTKDDFPELLTVVYWLKQVIGIILGCVWGLVPLLGATGIITFAAVNAGITFLYIRFYLDVDVESYGAWELLSEGFFPSFGLFVLSWSVTYTALHTTLQH